MTFPQHRCRMSAYHHTQQSSSKHRKRGREELYLNVGCCGAEGVQGKLEVHMANTAWLRQHNLKQVVIPGGSGRGAAQWNTCFQRFNSTTWNSISFGLFVCLLWFFFVLFHLSFWYNESASNFFSNHFVNCMTTNEQKMQGMPASGATVLLQIDFGRNAASVWKFAHCSQHQNSVC